MKIERHGFQRIQGFPRIEFNSPKFAWDGNNSSITIKDRNIKDFSTDSRHDYTVYLSLEEIQDLFQAVSQAAVNDPNTFQKALEKSEKQLIRLIAVIAGAKTFSEIL